LWIKNKSNGAEEKLEACKGVSANVQTRAAREYPTMVQLCGGGGDRQFIKKIKTGGMNPGLMMQTLEDRKQKDNRA
jgi:hypothetical protein